MEFSNLINRDVLLISIIVFTIVYILRVLLRDRWDNSIVQRFVVIIPIFVGGIVGCCWRFEIEVVGYLNKISYGILGSIYSMVFYKFLKDVLGGKDFFEIVSDFISNKKNNYNSIVNKKDN